MPAWWDSPDALARLVTYATWAGIVLAVLAAVSGAVTLLARNRRDAVLAVPARLSAAEEALRAQSLTPEQEQQLVAALAPFAGSIVTIVVIVGDPNAYTFAQQINPVFDRAGFAPRGLDTEMVFGGATLGMYLAIHSLDTQPPYTGVLFNMLHSFGLLDHATINQGLAPGALELGIGNKPLRKR
jgi:hypothetical protein